jgi:hypothetical protein
LCDRGRKCDVGASGYQAQLFAKENEESVDRTTLLPGGKPRVFINVDFVADLQRIETDKKRKPSAKEAQANKKDLKEEMIVGGRKPATTTRGQRGVGA